MILSGVCLCASARSAESTEESIALYADAANFQTGGALELAIDSWKKFLKKYPDDDLASKAAHYLGVCYMQREAPDYVAASQAFAVALRDKKYDLREESLANQGWCYYASAGEGPKRDPDRLQQTIDTFALLRKENSKSDYIDRAYFYSGEAAYGLGRRDDAIRMYDRFLKLPGSKDSPLFCDAIYARGIAQEELKQADAAIKSYQQLIQACANTELATDARLRLGDLLITRREFGAAVAAFDGAMNSATQDADISYAIFRQAYALVQDGNPNEAAKRYDRLQRDYPDSPYAANATLASGQSLYRGGKTTEAAKRFEEILGSRNRGAATEAAHWLVRIRLSEGQIASAAKIARDQLRAGTEGEFETDLRVDLAEALALSADTIEESISVAEQAYRDAPDDPLAPRALYNAAFSALQLNNYPKAGDLAGEFLKRFSRDQLSADVRFIVAESQLMSGETDDALASYRRLLRDAEKSNPQRPVWVLRAATAMNAARGYDDAIALLKGEYADIEQNSQRAEAQFLVGQAHLMSGRAEDAAVSFGRCLSVDPNWPRAAEAQLLRGTALMSDGNTAEAKQAWEAILGGDNTRILDQAQYKLAQLASGQGNHRQAVIHYSGIINAERDKGLLPFALYGRGWSNMQLGNHKESVTTFTRLISEMPDHRVSADARIARGICHRTLGDLDQAKTDLADFLEDKPEGTNLGHALYELALIEQKQTRHPQAAALLRRLVREVPDYASMDKVLYELGWSLREAGEEQAAEQAFRKLLSDFPNVELAGEAAYFVGQQRYAASEWDVAVTYFQTAAERAEETTLNEKAHYRLGWSHFKNGNYTEARKAFDAQSRKHPRGDLSLDAVMMVGECAFKEAEYQTAIDAYAEGRRRIRENNDSSRSIRDSAERRVRELILLHGGQSAAQLKKWDDAIGWYEELKERFPATSYLPQVFYETGFAYQQKNEDDRALKNFTQVADGYRNEIAARARFMMGEIYFGKRQFDKAIPEFQRVMYGFGAEKAPEDIKNWQAKSGFEAARCSELLMQTARTSAAKAKSRQFAAQFYRYVIDKHGNHELSEKSAARLEALP
ncbi:MAG: tetratricopeptide repeat protein [Planctomycetota bacterium]